MIITDSKTIKEIQKEFNNKFPFLRIEFYKEAHSAKEGSPDSMKWDSEKTIEVIRKIHNSGDLSIKDDQKISELEANLLEQYGLNAQVFYKSGNLWLQTTATDEWTLKQQNDRAESFTKFQENKI